MYMETFTVLAMPNEATTINDIISLCIINRNEMANLDQKCVFLGLREGGNKNRTFYCFKTVARSVRISLYNNDNNDILNLCTWS